MGERVTAMTLETLWDSLGGGLIFFVHPDPWGNDPIWRTYFSDGLKPPTRILQYIVIIMIDKFLQVPNESSHSNVVSWIHHKMYLLFMVLKSQLTSQYGKCTMFYSPYFKYPYIFTDDATAALVSVHHLPQGRRIDMEEKVRRANEVRSTVRFLVNVQHSGWCVLVGLSLFPVTVANEGL